ncbi:SH3 domain-containing protein, partial [Arcobacter porcinus]
FGLHLTNENQQRIIDISNSINIPKIEIPTNLLEIGKIFDSPSFKVFENERQRLEDMINSINIPKIEIPTNFLEISKIFDNSMFKAFQENQQIFKNFIDINNITKSSLGMDSYLAYIDKLDINNISEKIVEDFTKEEKEQLDNFINSFPEKISIIEYIKKILFILYILIGLIPDIYFVYALIQNKPIYAVNRDNVRIRETPTTETNKNIIKKLNRNEYVIKIDNKNGWIKVKYNSEDGKELEGWIYQTMLSKIN